MGKKSTTVRLDARLHREVVKKAKKSGLDFSGVVHLLLTAFTDGEVEVGATQYPNGYLDALEKESAELSRLYRAGKIKGYTSAKTLLDDIIEK